jgi:hypothetical protein
MDELRIGPVDGADLRELATVMVEAFADEGIHAMYLTSPAGGRGMLSCVRS